MGDITQKDIPRLMREVTEEMDRIESIIECGDIYGHELDNLLGELWAAEECYEALQRGPEAYIKWTNGEEWGD